MAEKDKGKTEDPVESDPSDPTPQPEPVPEPKPGEPPAPTIPKEFEGKTPEDLRKMVTDAQKELGGQAKEIGDLRNDLAFSKQLRELELQRAKESQAVLQPEEQKPDWNFEEPVKSVQEIVKRELNTREQKRQQGDLQRVKDEAKSNYAEGRSLAMKQSPGLFEGIERETEDAVYNSYMTGIIGMYALRNPEAWTMAAKMIHLRDNNIDRLQAASVSPVETVGGELPTPAKPGTTEKSFTGLDYTDEDVQKMVKQYGLTKEEAEEIVKGEQEAIAKGERR